VCVVRLPRVNSFGLLQLEQLRVTTRAMARILCDLYMDADD